MSYNAIVPRDYMHEVAVLLATISDNMVRWRSAATYEERTLVEMSAIDLFKRLKNFDLNQYQVSIFDHPDIQELQQVYGDISYVMKMNSYRLASITQLFLQYYNSQQLTIAELEGKLRRIKQKQAALNLWAGEGVKFALVEKFWNLDNIETDYISSAPLSIDTERGIATLPISQRITLTPSKVTITGQSNGSPGSSDVSVDTTNNDPTVILDTETNQWFEYERLDSGPCILELQIQLTQSQIINAISIEPVNIGIGLPFYVEDIKFINNEQTLAIRDLLPNRLPKDFFAVKLTGATKTWTTQFLPVQASTILIRLRQSDAYSIDVANADGDKVTRNRFAIAIQAIELHQILYQRSGAINSTPQQLRNTLLVGDAAINIYPADPTFYNGKFDYSLNQGNTWDSKSSFTIGIDQNTLIWRLALERNDDAFSSVASIYPEKNNTVQNRKAILRSVSRFQSPTQIALPEKPADNKVFVIQPKIGRRGSKAATVKIGDGVGAKARIRVPFDLLSNDLKPETIHVYVNGVEYSRVNADVTPGPEQWKFSEDFEEIIFEDALSSGTKVDFLLDDEIMSLIKKSDGYYHYTKLLFDPDKENIEIKYLPGRASRFTTILPQNRTTIALGKKNIIPESFDLSGLNITFNQVSTLAEVYDAVDRDYYVDFVNGIIYLSQHISGDRVRVTFRHFAEKTLAPESFEIVYDEQGAPIGVRILKNFIEALDVVDTVGRALQSVIDLSTGIYGPRNSLVAPSATNVKQLSHGCIIKNTLRVSDNLFADTDAPEEIDYIDGVSEFYGLVPSNEEKTVAIEADASGIVDFNLGAGSLWYKDFGVVFENSGGYFSNLVNDRSSVITGNIGDYYISDTGQVSVNVGAGNTLAADIDIHYYFKNPSFEPRGKYSVDYDNGIMYGHEDFVNGATIKYKVGCYKIAYDIAKQINSYVYDSSSNSVSVRTENLNKTNNLVKVLWLESPPTSNTRLLKDFFSPLVSTVRFRFV